MNAVQNIPTRPSTPEVEEDLDDRPVEVITEMVNNLKLRCLEKAEASGNTNVAKWILLAIAVSLLAVSFGFIGAALATQEVVLGQFGIYLLGASILSMASMALCTKTDYAWAATRVNEELVLFAEKNDLELTPDNIVINRAICELIEKRKAEEAKNSKPEEQATSV